MKPTILFLSTLFLFSCNKPTPLIEKASWIIGTWQNTSKDGVFTETWVKQNDSLLVGKGWLVNGKDTLFSEYLEIRQRGNDLFYIPTVVGQNDGKPVEFKLTSSDKQLVFENPLHDFPQKITCMQQGNDSLIAEVSGVDKGVQRSEKFPMERVK